MRGRLISRSATLTILVATGVFSAASCATVAESADRAARRAAGREVAERVDRTIGGAADRTEDAVLGNDDASSPPTASSQPSADPGVQPTASTSTRVANENIGIDFERGERELFADDFAADNVGDFPRRLTWRKGNMEVVDWEGRPLLRALDQAALSIDLGETLPQKFTLEMMMHVPGTGSVTILTGELPNHRWYQDYPAVNFGGWRGSGLYTHDGNPTAVGEMQPLREALIPVRIMMDGQHLKVYQGNTRVANVPQVEIPRTEQIHFMFDAREDRLVYVGDIRVHAGGRDLYAVLEEEGRFTARGIEFDTGSDRIRASSEATLDEIGAMLTEHPSLRVVIEGHTDAEGSEASNRTLSERRAASVRAYLIDNYAIEGERLDASGFGESKPVAPNDTPEGRQQNRRVEIAKVTGSE